MNEGTRFKILVGVGILFLLQQVAQNAPILADRSAMDSRKKVIEIYLRSLLLEYYALLESKHAQALPPVRVNLALPTRHLFGWRLKIYYWWIPDVGSPYSAGELATGFKKGEGAGGIAWKIKDIVAFDAKGGQLAAPTKSLSKENQALTTTIATVLSVPVIKKSKVVGVLSIDSEFPAPATQLHSMDAIRLAKSYADALADFCFSDGVK